MTVQLKTKQLRIFNMTHLKIYRLTSLLPEKMNQVCWTTS